MKLLSYLALSALVVSTAWAEPQEKTIVKFERTAQSSDIVQAAFTKNAYRTEQVQVPYTERIPYQETETYYENVPYTETVPYQDTETYYEQEYQCRNVTDYEERCAYENKCRTEYDNECRNEPVCHTEPGREECSIERICRRGQNGEQCFDKNVCRTVVGGRQVCRDNNVCRQVPRERCSQERTCRSFPVTRQECGYVSVPRTRTVTKYRQETRYRQEERTRTVTKYREETRCCRTEERLVFDHQWSYNLELRFDAQAKLNPGETEIFEVVLGGTEAAPNVTLRSNDTHIFKYELVLNSQSATQASADIKAHPKYNAEDLGEGTIQAISLSNNGSQAIIKFLDKGLRKRVQTQYVLRLLAQGQTLAQTQLAAGSQSEVQWLLPAGTRLELNMELQIDVARAGENLDQPVAFSAKQTLVTLSEAELKDAKKLQMISIVSQGATDPVLLWDDQLAGRGAANNTYKIEVYDEKARKLLGSKTFTESQLVRGGTGAFITKMSTLGLDSSTIRKNFKPGKKVYVRVKVAREVPSLGKTIETKREYFVTVK